MREPILVRIYRSPFRENQIQGRDVGIVNRRAINEEVVTVAPRNLVLPCTANADCPRDSSDKNIVAEAAEKH